MADNKTQIIITAKDETRAAIASAQRGLQSLQAAGASVGSTLAGIGLSGGIVGFLGGAGAGAALKGAIDDLDALNLSAERLGVSASKLETLNFAGKLAGLADDDIEKALTKISVKLEEAAAGSKEAIAWFTKLGVAWLDASGKVKTADAAFVEISERISAMEDGTGKVTTLVEGFGEKLGRKLAPALNSGAKGLEALRLEAEALGGGSYNLDELARQADTFNDNLDKLAFASRAAGRGIVEDLLPSLNDTTDAMVKLIAQGNTLQAVLRGIAGVGKLPFDLILGGVTKDLKDLSVDNQVKGLEQKLGGLQTKLKDASQPGGLLGRLVYGKPDEIRREIEVTQNQIASLVKFKDKLETKPEAKEPPKTTGGATPKADKPKSGGGGRSQIDEAERLIASLNEQIALKQVDADSTDKMTAAEQQAARVRYQLEAGTLKATEAQRAAINARLDDLVSMDKALMKQREFADAVKKVEESTARQRQEMMAATEAAEAQADAYGMSSAQLSTMTQARLEDAIATARQNGAGEEQIKVLEEELALRERYTAALEKSDLARDLAATKSAKEAQETARKARYDVALAKGDITEKQYKELVDNLKQDVDEMGEFMKQAARNMQDAFAELFINPTGDGIRSWGETFAKTLQKMIAQAGSAQLLKLMLGDVDKTGSLGGWIGDLIKPLKNVNWSGLFGGASSSFIPYEWANGGIMTSAGPLPLNTYAGGGIATRPQLALFGEGRTPEAYVPLPDGKRIPVAMHGGTGANITVNVNSQTGDPAEIRRSAAAGARTALGLMSGAGRYR